MELFYRRNGCGFPVREPTDIINSLEKGELQYKPGRSACELAKSWVNANGIPQSVERVLDGSTQFRCARLLRGWFERKTTMPARGRESQTDLLAICATTVSRAVLAIEGKVDEPLGEPVRDWLKSRADLGDIDNRRQRLGGLCTNFGYRPGRCRRATLSTSSPLLCRGIRGAGARHGLCGDARLHSFCRKHSWRSEFETFAHALGLKLEYGMTDSKTCRMVIALSLAWVADQPSAQ